MIVFATFVRMKRENKSNLNMHSVLKRYWGYDEFRPMQHEIINSILAGNDTLAMLPTGGGKSLTYQVPALMMEGICIVVTPLIALMKDQVDKLRSLSIPAAAIHSGLSPRQIDIALDNCIYGDTKLLYVAPERITTEIFRYRVQRMKVSMIAIDEAHCISQWGYDFRPSYLKIAELREHTGGAPVLALTASATPIVVQDIMERLKFDKPNVIRGKFNRPNLVYAIRHIEDKDEQMMKIINNVEGCGIVYVRTRANAESLSKELNNKGISASYYHGGLPHIERSIRQDEWIKGCVRVIVATNAFGMGIDKPDVRFVIHYSLCDSLESYYQEAGRAGRDGLRSYAVLLVSPDDISRISKLQQSEFPPIDTIKSIYDKICSSLQIAIGQGELSSHIFNIYEFCSREKLYRGTVVNAIKILEMNNYLSLTEELENPARLMFCVNRDDLYKVRVDHNELDHFLRVLLRLYEGLFSDFRAINEIEIAHWSGYTPHKVNELLKRLWQMRLVRYIPANRAPLIFLSSERLAISDLYISPDSYKFRWQMSQQRFDQMVDYTSNYEVCRSVKFNQYFGVDDPLSQDCNICDVCIEKRRNTNNSQQHIEELILEALSNDSELSVKELALKIKASNDTIAKAVEQLIDNNKIIASSNSNRLRKI